MFWIRQWEIPRRGQLGDGKGNGKGIERLWRAMGDDCMMQSLSYDVPRSHGPPTHAPQHPVTSKMVGRNHIPKMSWSVHGCLARKTHMANHEQLCQRSMKSVLWMSYNCPTVIVAVRYKTLVPLHPTPALKKIHGYSANWMQTSKPRSVGGINKDTFCVL